MYLSLTADVMFLLVSYTSLHESEHVVDGTISSRDNTYLT